MRDLQICVGCGSALAAHDGPVHAYMTSSPACWAAFGEVMAAEYSTPALLDVHRLSVDAWAIQHPGDGSRRAIQSVGLHLARLLVQLEMNQSGFDANNRMLEFARRKATLAVLPPPPHWSMTVADVLDSVGTTSHRSRVAEWARAVWADCAPHHPYIRRWIAA